jgi:hypothetical protein
VRSFQAFGYRLPKHAAGRDSTLWLQKMGHKTRDKLLKGIEDRGSKRSSRRPGTRCWMRQKSMASNNGLEEPRRLQNLTRSPEGCLLRSTYGGAALTIYISESKISSNSSQEHQTHSRYQSPHSKITHQIPLLNVHYSSGRDGPALHLPFGPDRGRGLSKSLPQRG